MLTCLLAFALSGAGAQAQSQADSHRYTGDPIAPGQHSNVDDRLVIVGTSAPLVLPAQNTGAQTTGPGGDINDPDYFKFSTLEHFRVLDSFQLPLEAVGPATDLPAGLEPLKYGSTQYTVSFDTKNMVVYYHTDDDRASRSVGLKKVNWDTLDETKSAGRRRSEDVTPAL